MPSYNYTAVTAKGRTIRGSTSAENDLDLEARLRQLGLELVSSRELSGKRKRGGRRIKVKDLIVVCLHLEQLDRAGVPLHDALADVRDSVDSPKLKDVLADIYESVKNGVLFSKALAQHPNVFDSVFVGLISSAEKTGNLTDSYHHLAEHMKWTMDLRRKVKKAIKYPIALLLVLTGVISVLMVAVVPKLVDFIMSQGFTLPAHTRALIAFSNAFQNYWYIIFGTPVLIAMTIIILTRTSENFAYRWDSLKLRIPLVGTTLRKIDLARFSQFFSVMFRSGIDVLDSLEGAKGVVRNRVIKESIDFVKTSVTEGNSITASLQFSNQFPNLVIRMFKVGEDSGNMNSALENINFFYNREVNDSVDNLVGMIQPMLTVVMGLMIFWIIAAVFGPLYQSFSKMKF
jgi:type IV pilus assembly protein PilC